MDHGWDDDLDDLDIEEDEKGEAERPSHIAVNDTTATTTMMMMMIPNQQAVENYDDDGGEDTGGGWEEDDDLFGNDDDDEDDVVASTTEAQQEQGQEQHKSETLTYPKSSAEEGWGDEDGDLNFDDDWGDNDNVTSTTATAGVDHLPTARTPSPFGGGGGNHYDSTGTTQSNEGNGWDDYDDDGNNKDIGTFENETMDTNVHDPLVVETGSRHLSSSPRNDRLLKELQDYVSSLDRILSSINAILEFEYNTPEKAQELFHYYAERPGLAAYTRTKELPRMSYHVILPNGHVETDKQAIANHHLPDESLIARCANQSLLADLLQVLTGPDLVVRPQFLASCVAESCQFRLHYGDNGRDMVQVNCMLQLSLPQGEGGTRFNIATIRATIVFSPKQHEPSMVKFRVDKIIVMLKESDYSKLEQVVSFLVAMEGDFDDVMGHSDTSMQSASADIFRDAFLEQSQQIMHQSKVGMKSALKDMESVIGLKSKFKAVQVGISKFLPDTNVMLEAEEEGRRLAAERQAQHPALPPRPSLPPSRMDSSNVPIPPPSLLSEQMFPPPPPPRGHTVAPPVSIPNKEEAARPRSILGGLVMSGWGALAKTMTVPDEDPAIYGPVTDQQPPLFYRKEEPVTVQAPETFQPYRHPHQPLGPSPIPGTQSLNVPSRQEDFMPHSDLIPQQNHPHNIGLEEVVDESSVQSGDGWDDDLDLTTEMIHDEEPEGEDPVSHPIEHAEGKQTNEFADTADDRETTGSSFSVPSPSSGITSFVPQSSSAPIQISTSPKTTTSRPSQIPAYTTPSSPTVIVPTDSVPMIEPPKRITRRSLVADDISYNPEDDIIPTRQRWVNPRPFRDYIFVEKAPNQ